MPLTDSPEDLFWVRSKIGDSPDDGRLDEVFDSDGIGSRGLTVLWVLEHRLANLLAEPASFSIPEQYSQSTTANITALREQIQEIKVEIAAELLPEGFESIVGVLSRDDYVGRR